MLHEVGKIDPKRILEVSSTKTVQYSKSDAYFFELMEDLCKIGGNDFMIIEN